MPFEPSKILVVGATSGIGQALATRFLENDISVVAVGRRQDRLDEFQKTHHGSARATVSTIAFDITQLSEIPRFAQDAFTAHPDIDSILLNSGLQRPLDWTRPAAINLADVDTEILTNYTAYMHLTAALLPYLQAHAPKPTSLLYTSSGLALVPLVTVPNYCGTKAALHHHCLAIRSQLDAHAGNNVKIVEIFPPAVQSELHDYQGKEKGRNVGIPMSRFVDETWRGLNADGAAGEQIFVAGSNDMSGGGVGGGWEMERQKRFAKMTEMVRQR